MDWRIGDAKTLVIHPATTTHQQLTAEEQQAAIKAFANPDETQGHGVRLAGQKFFTLQATDEHVYGKKGVRLTPPAPASFLLSVFDAFYFPAHRDATSLNDF